MRIVKIILLLIFSNISVLCFSQKFNFTTGTSNILFERLYNKKVFFNGLSFNSAYYFKRFGWTIDLNFYFSSTYYGKTKGYSFNNDKGKDEPYYSTPVYFKGGAFSIGPGVTYKIYVSKTQKTVLLTDVNFLMLNLNQSYNKEPFIRLYGGADSYEPTIYSSSFGFKLIKKIKYLPLSISIKRHFNIQSKINYQYFSGYYELKIGIAFPIVYGNPPSTIIKIKY
ncbi:MAG: hypothetical protein A2X08_03645 [Bacteroidetes bacterium GWA2_32_17]|nr:MAG: hypothetical protein A2X08_03645 [Bacteroidetes bacterium GWA2_32_17]